MYARSAERSDASLKGTAEPLGALRRKGPSLFDAAGRREGTSNDASSVRGTFPTARRCPRSRRLLFFIRNQLAAGEKINSGSPPFRGGG